MKKSERKSHLHTIGNREIETHGLDTGFWRDLYHRSLTVHWPVFFGTAAGIFVTLTAVFAFLYWLGDRPVANVSDDSRPIAARFIRYSPFAHCFAITSAPNRSVRSTASSTVSPPRRSAT